MSLCQNILVAWVGMNSLGYCEGGKGNAGTAITLENDYVRYVIGANGYNLSFVDKRTGRDHCVQEPQQAFVILKRDGRDYEPSTCSFAEGKITVEFDQPRFTAVINVEAKGHYFVFEVVSVSDGDVEELVFSSLHIKPSKYVSGMSGVAADDDFAVCLRALNLQVGASVSGTPPLLQAACYPKYGLVGAKVALVGCPAEELRSVLKEVVRQEGLPYSSLGGPWALDAEENRGSYVFASVSEDNVEEWIELAKRAGLAQIHIHGWWRSLGHYEPRQDLFPHGLEGLKAVVDKIHEAGLKAGMHTLTGCISPIDPFATPVPDKRLAKDATFTLAGSVSESDRRIPTLEQPHALDTIWAYASHGNVIQIDDELIQYTLLAEKPPYGFTNCTRGAFGTKTQSHEKGAAVHHLFVRYTSFLPDENSTLVDEVAECIARAFNTCGFDMIYMDGAEGMMGGWHGVAKMRGAIFNKIKRRVLVEASSWGYHSWPFHSRIGAWDHPRWGVKRFIDAHCQAMEQYRSSALLPAQLGWWALLGPSADWDAQLPDEIEYLCCKALGYDAPMSFQGVYPSQQPANARQDEYLKMIGQYERLRLTGYFSDSVKARLKAPKEEFRLVQAQNGVWHFIPTDYATHKVTGLRDGSNTWTVRFAHGRLRLTVNNRFDAQPVRLRIQALHSAAPYDSADGLVLAEFDKEGEFGVREAASGVTHALTSSTEQVKGSEVSGCYSAENTMAQRRGAWAEIGKVFSPPLDLRRYGALGVWVYGDGKGELLNLQLRDPPQYYHGTYDEHYVDVDFTGWRYFELLLRERDAERHGDYVWPYSGTYQIYRSPLVREHVSALNLYYNNLPPSDSVKCYLSPIKALPTVKVKMENPSVTIGGKRIVFPVTLESGQYIEFASTSNCKLYDERGAVVEEIKPQGEAPTLAAGENTVTFTCAPPEGYNARANVTVISSGEPLSSEEGSVSVK